MVAPGRIELPTQGFSVLSVKRGKIMIKHNEIKNMLIEKLNNTNMGDIRIFKYVYSIVGSVEKTKDFLIKEGYAKWEVNKIERDIQYKAKRYENKNK